MKLRIAEVVVPLLLIGIAPAAADPIAPRQILGGQFDTTSLVGQFTIFGDGFTLQGRADVNSGPCTPCAGGDAAVFFALSEVRVLSGTVDGVTYPAVTLGNPFEGIPSAFNLQATASTLIPMDATTGTQLTFPFGINPRTGSRFVGYAAGDRFNPLFDLPVTGSGTGTVTLHLDDVLNGKPIFSGTQITWAFDAPASPTPEPASMLLFATGIGTVLVARRRARRAASRWIGRD
jgi:hypothetical protein